MKLWGWWRKDETWTLKLSNHLSRQYIDELHERCRIADERIVELEQVRPEGWLTKNQTVITFCREVWLAVPLRTLPANDDGNDPRLMGGRKLLCPSFGLKRATADFLAICARRVARRIPHTISDAIIDGYLDSLSGEARGTNDTPGSQMVDRRLHLGLTGRNDRV